MEAELRNLPSGSEQNHLLDKKPRKSSAADDITVERSTPSEVALGFYKYLGESASVNLEDDPIGLEMSGHDKGSKGAKKVLFSFYLNQLLNLNIVEENFQPQFDICTDWVDDGVLQEGSANYWSGGYSFKIPEGEVWTPKLCLMNDISDGTPVSETTTVNSLQGRPVVAGYQVYLPTLRCPLNLTEFPFDKQELPIVVSSNWDTSDISFLLERCCIDDPSYLYRNSINPEILRQSSEYVIHDIKVEQKEHKFANLMRYDSMNHGYPELIVKICVARKPEFYTRGIALIIILVLFMGALPFWLDHQDTGTRFSISTTMFLTLVAFHFVFWGSLPKVSYLTRMDKWMVCCYAAIFMANIENLVIYRLSLNPELCNTDCLESADISFFFIYITLVLLSYVWFIWPSRNHRVFLDKAKDYEKDAEFFRKQK
eukprot:TRINITY_DN9457_c0_g1_i1.p1 TRINITY_DN9457_c0_g1~~TRINITY_DN9457_c0_g1_i1.p1  ORF type:complete len:427 (+),score=92.91 TRINITY_DN9457_c0_g1_i1:59-1339(+)